MRFSTAAVALGALFMGASADVAAVAPEIQTSVLMVLAHAIPSQSISYALASPAAFASEMASCLSASSTPAWYQALPTDVQSLLPQIYPQETPTPSPTPSSTPSSTPSPTPTPSSSAVVTPYPTAGLNSTSAITKPPTSATGTISLSLIPTPSATGPEGPAFTGAASRLSLSAGLGAFVGLVGVLAL
ncbi:hypothetical protein COCCADRAFT_100154 [Bipolaris zeicola 26-R-13]|uniref:Uncharacterized protein n=1 Tax=Cochliobolus carbonum (strain 26-R-13) TaxID=930089 RepID=W6XWQ2_COCC2|nr:uncharacterized protein COCCADRAFT_100154 [Bipolaris zeicola 26-R-13]EUC31872.1 hypothetical protein COCCADRAFT_100154 [Bipolaris zeicola 26-R-13]